MLLLKCARDRAFSCEHMGQNAKAVVLGKSACGVGFSCCDFNKKEDYLIARRTTVFRFDAIEIRGLNQVNIPSASR